MGLWLIGAGFMAREYAKVLQALNVDFKVIGRSAASTESFETDTGHPVIQGGLSKALNQLDAPDQAIIAVGVEQLAPLSEALIKAGTRNLLVEKPGGLNTAEIKKLHRAATKHNASVLMAYNRRFYEATSVAKRLIAEDGGAVSCNFEFTEWSHIIEPLTKAPGVKESWFLANSTHVADLAFYLCGFPKDWKFWHGGSLKWHPSSARFCGSGITNQGVFFSYHADWEAPGRWGVEVLTKKRRFIFRPMESLHVVNIGTVKTEMIDIDDQLDTNFKPGLYKQIESFLKNDNSQFCSISEQLDHCKIYDDMVGYK